MDKVKFIAVVVLCVLLAYVIMLPLWSIVTASAFATATSINGTANAYTHRFTIGALRFAPLMLWFVPAAIGVGCIVWKLKFSQRSNG